MIYAVCAQMIFGAYINKQIKSFFPEDDLIQNQIIPRWRANIRDFVEDFLPPPGRIRRFVTVVFPENFLTAIWHLSMGFECTPVQLYALCTTPLITLSMIPALFGLCYFHDFGRFCLPNLLIRWGANIKLCESLAPSDGLFLDQDTINYLDERARNQPAELLREIL